MKKLRIHCFQHVSFEGLGCIETWALQHEHLLTYSRFYETYEIPDVNEIDWLIVMGGPMGAYDEDKYDWMSGEKSFIKKAIDKGKTVLGICLGSQIIAEVLGAKVYPNVHKEIGWFDISLTVEGTENPFFNLFKSTFKVFHWHGDTFDLPQGALHISYSEGCKNQAFLYKERVLGLQFHFEVTSRTLKEMVENGRDELVKERYIQSATEILANTEFIRENNFKLYSILDKLAKT